MTSCTHSLEGQRQPEDEIQHRSHFTVETDPSWDQTTDRDRFITMSIEAMRQANKELNKNQLCQTNHSAK